MQGDGLLLTANCTLELPRLCPCATTWIHTSSILGGSVIEKLVCTHSEQSIHVSIRSSSSFPDTDLFHFLFRIHQKGTIVFSFPSSWTDSRSWYGDSFRFMMKEAYSAPKNTSFLVVVEVLNIIDCHCHVIIDLQSNHTTIFFFRVLKCVLCYT